MQPTPADTPDPSPREPVPPEAATPGPAGGGSGAPFPYEPVHPDLLAWARQTFDMKEFMEGVRDIEVNGGKSLEEFIDEIEAVVRES